MKTTERAEKYLSMFVELLKLGEQLDRDELELLESAINLDKAKSNYKKCLAKFSTKE